MCTKPIIVLYIVVVIVPSSAWSEDSREVLSDGEVSGELADEVGGEKRDDSMSLKAELLKVFTAYPVMLISCFSI